MRGIKKGNQALINAINGASNSFDFDADTAAPMQPVVASVAGERNPKFESTFNLQFLTKYYTLNSGTYTGIAASALNAALKNALPFFIFGSTDFASGYAKIQGEFPINSNWSYARGGVFGKDDFSELAFDATVEADLQDGDMVIPFTSALPGTGTTTLALNIIRCKEVAYGSIVEALLSDRFNVSGFRYFIDDVTKIAQYNNQVQFSNLSIFGKFVSDRLTPNDYKDPDQFQNGIVNVPVVGKWGGIDKHKIWGFSNNFDNVDQSWTIFVVNVRKVSA